MVKITNADLEVSRDLFLRAHEMYKRSGLTSHDAFDAACLYFENEGYMIRYTSFESFKTNALYKRK